MSSTMFKRVLTTAALVIVPTVGITTNANATTPLGSKAVSYIEKHDMGKKYSEGSGRLGPNEFDCSGLMYSAFKNVGRKMVYHGQAADVTGTEWAYLTAKHQVSYKHQTSKHHTVQKGDILFYWSGGHVVHVGIYVGNYKGKSDQVIDAPRPGKTVRAENAFYNWGFSYITFGWVK